MLGFLFGGSSASESETNSLKKKCGTRESAVKVCLRGNSAAACDTFQQDLDLCKGPCGAVATTPDCTKDLMAMRKCLKSKKV